MTDFQPPGPPADIPPGPGYWKASDGNWYPPQPAPGASPWGSAPIVPPPGYVGDANGLATAALVLGILGICLFWIPFVGPLLAILGIIFGVIGINKAKVHPGQPLLGRAKAGLITGIVGTVIGLGFFLLVVAAVDDAAEDYERIGRAGINTDPPDGSCNFDRLLQDPDC